VSLVISQLTVRVREQAEAAQRRQTVTATLFALSRDLAIAHNLEEVVDAVIRNVTQTFGREVAILLPASGSPADLPAASLSPASGPAAGQPTDGMRAGPVPSPRLPGLDRLAAHGTGTPWAGAPVDGGASRLQPQGMIPDFMREQNELAVATWAFQHDQEAGRGSETLPASAARYLPLKTARGVVGVIGVKPINPDAILTPDEHRLLEAFASLAALSIERVQLAEVARNAQVLAASEKLQTALLNSISHDLRTPLVSVTGSLSALSEEGGRLDEATRRELIDTARGEAERLNRLVGNLLDMTRIEAGAMKIDRQPSDVQAVIGSALEELNSRLGARQVQVEVPSDLPLAPLDPALMMHVLINLIDNALKYSPAPAPIEISARATAAGVELAVSDRGVGIASEELERVFDKFYRIEHPDSAGGTGLGLSICKGIIEAHGGTIHASQRPGGGTTIIISLPLYGQQPEEGHA
jgi:two-component system, OmpR family, sensor histidine kinase KdpD